MAAIGDSDGQLMANARSIRASGQNPVYLTVQAPKRTYHFSVYAQLVQAPSLLIVRGYGRIFVYPLSSVEISYDGSTVLASSLPSATLPGIQKIANGRQPGVFTQGDIQRKERMCPDCVALMGYRPLVRLVFAKLNGILDAWQESPTYVAFAPTPPPVGPIKPLSIKTMAAGAFSCYFTYNGFVKTGGSSGGGTPGTSTWDWGPSAGCPSALPSYSAYYQFKLPAIYVYMQLSTAGSGAINPVLNAAHIYLEVWASQTETGGTLAPVSAYQAGQDRNGCLSPATFSQSPTTQPKHLILSNSVAAIDLVAKIENDINRYQTWNSTAPPCTIEYGAGTSNSNTWLDGLLLAAGYSQNAIDGMVNDLRNQTGDILYPYGYEYGNTLTNYFLHGR